MRITTWNDPKEPETEGRDSKGQGVQGFDFETYGGSEHSRFYVAVPFEYYKEMEYLSNAEFGELIRLLLWYGMTGEVPPVEGVLRHYINRVIQRQKRFQDDWDRIAQTRSQAGKKGANKRWKKDQTQSPDDSYEEGESL